MGSSPSVTSIGASNFRVDVASFSNNASALTQQHQQAWQRLGLHSSKTMVQARQRQLQQQQRHPHYRLNNDNRDSRRGTHVLMWYVCFLFLIYLLHIFFYSTTYDYYTSGHHHLTSLTGDHYLPLPRQRLCPSTGIFYKKINHNDNGCLGGFLFFLNWPSRGANF